MDGMHGVDLYGDDPAPVRQLLMIGDAGCYTLAEWPDYPASFGLDQRHVGALIGMACDGALHTGDPNSSLVWAPVHAWRALGQLRAEASVQPLLALLKMREDDDAVDLEIPIVLGMIGSAAIPHIAGYVSDRTNPTRAVAIALSGLREIAERNPDCRGECIDILVRRLEPHSDVDASINGFAVSALIDLHAVESIDTIRDAFRRDDVDISIAGDVEDVEIELGLREKRATPAPRYAILPADWAPSLRSDRLIPDIDGPTGPRKIGRNEQCPCGSGKKYKKCCLK
jgi:hypothetical protein